MTDSTEATEKKTDPWAGFEKPMPEYRYKFLTYFDKWFQISARGSTYPREMIGGLTTFISMVYILTVNPSVLTSGPNLIQLWDSIFIATCLASFISTCVMAFLPNVPFALSCGLGLNAQVMLYTMGVMGPDYSYAGAMTIVFLSGLIFLIITLVGFREYIFDAIPRSIKSAIPVGIGLFIAFIGMQNSKIVVGGATLVTFVSIHDMYLDAEVRELAFNAIVCFIGLFAICILDHYRIKGCVFLGIIIAALIGIAFGVTPVENITKGWNVGERFKNFFSFDEAKGGSFGLCFPGFANAFETGAKVPTTIVLIISYGMVDLFDTLGTVYGLGLQSNLLDKETGKCHNFSRVLFADCIGAVFGSIFGTSSVTTYLESSTGIAVGARTGFSAFVVALLFLFSMFLSPIFFMIPDCATAPALIYVGVQMMSTVLYIDFSKIIDAIPVFITIVMMPLTYSITNGMCFGVISYSVVHIVRFIIDCIIYLITGKVYNPEATAGAENSEGAAAGENAKKDQVVEDISGDASSTSQLVSVKDPAEEKKEETPTKPVWPINIGLGIITILFALTVFLPTKWTKS